MRLVMQTHSPSQDGLVFAWALGGWQSWAIRPAGLVVEASSRGYSVQSEGPIVSLDGGAAHSAQLS